MSITIRESFGKPIVLVLLFIIFSLMIALMYLAALLYHSSRGDSANHNQANSTLSSPDSDRPVFANRKQIDDMSGRSYWVVDTKILNNETLVQYDKIDNMLVAGMRPSSYDLLLMPSGSGDLLRVKYEGVEFFIPHWKNSAILFDRSGIIKIVYLKSSKAEDIFHSIEKDESELDKLFGRP